MDSPEPTLLLAAAGGPVMLVGLNTLDKYGESGARLHGSFSVATVFGTRDCLPMQFAFMFIGISLCDVDHAACSDLSSVRDWRHLFTVILVQTPGFD